MLCLWWRALPKVGSILCKDCICPQFLLISSAEVLQDHACQHMSELGLPQCRTPIDSRLFEYDLESGQWSECACTGDVPSPRVAHTAAAVGQSLYIFGGRSGDHHYCSSCRPCLR